MSRDSRLIRWKLRTIADYSLRALASSLRASLTSLEDVLDNYMDGYREVRYSEPNRPETGMIVYADGSNWNPGSGEGHYEYRSDNKWYKL